MEKIFILFILISVFVSQAGFAAEIDSVTPRNIELDNSQSIINRIINQRIQEGVQKANAQQDDAGGFDFISAIDDEEFTEEYEACDEEILYTELRKAIFQSLTASWGLKGYDLDKQLRNLLAKQSYSLSLNDSIYRDIDYIEGFSLNLKELSDVVNINDHLIGLDKLGHFFAEGWQYYELTRYDDYTFNQALEWGRQQEAGKFGYSTTGIFSFADLVANFNGWRFWNKVLLKENDPLKGALANFFDSPYVSCDIQIIASIKSRKIVKAWEQNTEFDLSDFIDGTWDEGNNCNSYDDPFIEEKVTARIKNVSPDFTCPFVPENCLEAQERYGFYAKHVLHPYCLIATKE
ncbi:hypothetical protein JYT79_01020 [Cardiobacterium sp. AH-315-I02]|nr:hypothetical protein [Cardiobacterium sp. AH-315-I02]